jgi:tetratricopeptide (TPR) repeat protein
MSFSVRSIRRTRHRRRGLSQWGPFRGQAVITTTTTIQNNNHYWQHPRSFSIIPSLFGRRRRSVTIETHISLSPTTAIIISRPFFSSSSTDDKSSQNNNDAAKLFDPFTSPASASLLRQDDSDLSTDELALKYALQAYQKAKEKTNNHNNWEELIPDQTILEDLQRAYMDLEYWEEALHIEQDQCRLFLQPDTDEYADSIHAQGKLYLRQEDFDTSKRLYQQALDYFQSTNNSVQHGHVLISLAGWHFFRNQLSEALQCLHQAEVLLDSNPSLLVKCLDNQGLIYRLWGEFNVALDKYQQALQVVVVADSNMQQALRMHVADMLMALEDSDGALAAYQELLNDITNDNSSNGIIGKNGQQQQDQDWSMQGVLLHNIATIHSDQGEYDRALEEFRLALQMKERAGGEHNPEMARTWNLLGGLLAGIFDQKLQALECFQKALMIARIHASGDPQTDPDVMSALQNIATMEHELNNQRKG